MRNKLVLFLFGIFAVMMAASLAMLAPAMAQDPGSEDMEQVGAYSSFDNAATMMESLRAEGKNAFIKQKEVGGKTLYAVIIDHSTPMPLEEIDLEEAEPVMEPATEPEAEAGAEAAMDIEPESEMDTDMEPDMELEAELVTEELMGTETDMEAEVVEVIIEEPMADEDMAVDPGPAIRDFPAGSTAVLPVSDPAKTKSIRTAYSTEVYDRPFHTGRSLGTYGSLGGEFVREYLGWYAIRLPDGSFGFIRSQDAEPVDL